MLDIDPTKTFANVKQKTKNYCPPDHSRSSL